MNIFFQVILALLLIGCANLNKSENQDLSRASMKTKVHVVQWNDLKYKADSFFEERRDLSFTEAQAKIDYQEWATEAISKVNDLIPSEDRLPEVKIKLIFSALITGKDGKSEQVPISIIESYQEPKTASMRLGMLELQNDKLSFQLTVAHEYAHLIFEAASRRAGATPSDADQISFWPKSVYEGLADFVMSLALKLDLTAAPGNWSSSNLMEFETWAEARASKDRLTPLAKDAFAKMNLVPKYKIYADWLKKVELYTQSLGGTDPYAEGRWLAGSLKKHANNPERIQKAVQLILAAAKSGTLIKNTEEFQRLIVSEL